MARTILVPIDFRVESLNTLKFALAEQTEAVNVILLYSHFLGDSITELLFYSPHKYIEQLNSAEFEEALVIITNRHAKNILGITFKLLNANSLSLLKNLLSHLKVDAIYTPKSYKLKLGKKGFDPLPLLKDCKIINHQIDWTSTISASEKDQLDSLFN